MVHQPMKMEYNLENKIIFPKERISGAHTEVVVEPDKDYGKTLLKKVGMESCTRSPTFFTIKNVMLEDISDEKGELIGHEDRYTEEQQWLV